MGGTLVALDPHAETAVAHVDAEPPVVICLGAEREGLPPELLERAAVRARIPLRGDGPESLNVGMAATVALYELGNRMARHA
jgi:tRNA G18 (ribose-2'-O)-methylase SpoU